MATLTLTRDQNNTITGAAIEGNTIDGFQNVTQSLQGGKLVAILTVDFSTVTVTDGIPVPAPILTATFTAGATAGVTTLTITETKDDASNKFAYIIGASAAEQPNVGDIITGFTDVTGTTASISSVTTSTYVAVYELDSENKVVKFLDHQITTGEIGTD